MKKDSFIIDVEISTFLIEEDTDFSTCITCDDMIIGKLYQAVTMLKLSNGDIDFHEFDDLKICPACYEEVKHRFRL